VVLVSLPGFVFRAAANICRLISILTRKESPGDGRKRRTPGNRLERRCDEGLPTGLATTVQLARRAHRSSAESAATRAHRHLQSRSLRNEEAPARSLCRSQRRREKSHR
ncbi:hypothetical protein AK812_SmicGene33295, partial [Symbiodinium microadriaticum]